MLSLLLAALLSANGTGKTLVRQSPGRTVTGPTAARGSIFADDANTVCHAYWDGVQIRDTKGCAWTMTGTVPQVARAGRTPASAGPFANANYYSTAELDPMDLTTFTVAAVFSLSSTAGTNTTVVSNGAFQTAGYYLMLSAGDSPVLSNSASLTANRSGANAKAQSVTAISLTAPNVVIAGYDGTNIWLSLNGATTVKTAFGPMVAGTSQTAFIGKYYSAGTFLPGTICEILVSSAPPTDASVSQLWATARARLGVTAW